jgi:hypothetical protein
VQRLIAAARTGNAEAKLNVGREKTAAEMRVSRAARAKANDDVEPLAQAKLAVEVLVAEEIEKFDDWYMERREVKVKPKAVALVH